MFVLALLAATPAVTVHGDWGTVQRLGRCDALAQSIRRPAKDRPRGLAGFAFTPARGGPWGRFETRLSRVPRDGASVVLRIGAQSFLLIRRGDLAWGRDARQDRAILAAARGGGLLRIDSRDRSGRRFTDSYSLNGAPTAIDAAAASCARAR